MKNKLLLIFSENIFKNSKTNLSKLDEQLQIAFQVLINKGYKVLVAGDGDQAFEFSKRFSYIFQDENIKNTEDKLNELQKAELIKKSDCIVCFQEEEVKLAKLLNSQYIFINIADDEMEEQFDEFTIESLNAGEIVKKVEELIRVVVGIEDKDSIESNNIKYDVTKGSSDEFEEYKNKIKKTIGGFINNNQLEEAKNLMSEYESIVKDDVDIYSMKAICAIIENKLEIAEKILLQGNEIERNNFDILYNLAYIYGIQNNIELSKAYYRKAILNVEDKEIQESIYEKLQAMGEKCSLENILAENIENSTSIIILTYNNLEYTQLCIESIREYTEKGTYEIIVVDNNSTDGTRKWLKQQNDIKLILNKNNVGFPQGCNIGIRVAKLNNDILLLNNDTIVTPNWLNNLKKCLYSDVMNGAVGSVTNSCSYYQAIPVNYKNIDEMINFAQEYNKSDPDKWEQRIKLVGFCMLIKRNVLDKVGMLDERFSPGNFEDDDYSYRIQKSGYKLYLCNDTFIHHFGSTSFKKDPQKYKNLMQANSEKFKEKWGFHSAYSSFIRNEIIDKIDSNTNDVINVLEVGCACGATLLKIKHLYKNAKIYGIEFSEDAADIAKNFADVRAENVENSKLSYEEEYFDYIIFADVLEHLSDPWKVLVNMKKYLKPNGKLLASIPNVMHHTVIRDLVNGNWSYQDSGILDKTHIRFFTYREIDKMFKECGYSDLSFNGTMLNNSPEEEKFIDLLCGNFGEDKRAQYGVYQYIVSCKKSLNLSLQDTEEVSENDFIKDKVMVIFDNNEDLDRNKNLSVMHQILINSLRESSTVRELVLIHRELMFEIGEDKWCELIINKCKEEKIDTIIFHVPFCYNEKVIKTLLYLRDELKIKILGFTTDLKTACGAPNDTLYKVFKEYIKCMSYTLSIDTSSPQEYYGDHKFIIGFAPVDFNIFNSNKINKDIDVSFIGAIQGWRQMGNDSRYNYLTYIEKELQSSGINYRFIDTTGRGLELEEYASILNRSKLTINFSQTMGGETHMKGRVLEALASNCLLLEEKGDETKKYFNINEDYIGFDSKEELLEKIKYYANNDIERQKISLYGNKKVVNIFNNTNLWNYIFEKMGFTLKKDLGENYKMFTRKLDELSIYNKYCHYNSDVIQLDNDEFKLIIPAELYNIQEDIKKYVENLNEISLNKIEFNIYTIDQDENNVYLILIIRNSYVNQNPHQRYSLTLKDDEDISLEHNLFISEIKKKSINVEKITFDKGVYKNMSIDYEKLDLNIKIE